MRASVLAHGFSVTEDLLYAARDALRTLAGAAAAPFAALHHNPALGEGEEAPAPTEAAHVAPPAPTLRVTPQPAVHAFGGGESLLGLGYSVGLPRGWGVSPSPHHGGPHVADEDSVSGTRTPQTEYYAKSTSTSRQRRRAPGGSSEQRGGAASPSPTYTAADWAQLQHQQDDSNVQEQQLGAVSAVQRQHAAPSSVPPVPYTSFPAFPGGDADSASQSSASELVFSFSAQPAVRQQWAPAPRIPGGHAGTEDSSGYDDDSYDDTNDTSTAGRSGRYGGPGTHSQAKRRTWRTQQSVSASSAGTSEQRYPQAPASVRVRLPAAMAHVNASAAVALAEDDGQQEDEEGSAGNHDGGSIGDSRQSESSTPAFWYAPQNMQAQNMRRSLARGDGDAESGVSGSQAGQPGRPSEPDARPADDAPPPALSPRTAYSAAVAEALAEAAAAERFAALREQAARELETLVGPRIHMETHLFKHSFLYPRTREAKDVSDPSGPEIGNLEPVVEREPMPAWYRQPGGGLFAVIPAGADRPLMTPLAGLDIAAALLRTNSSRGGPKSLLGPEDGKRGLSPVHEAADEGGTPAAAPVTFPESLLSAEDAAAAAAADGTDFDSSAYVGGDSDGQFHRHVPARSSSRVSLQQLPPPVSLSQALSRMAIFPVEQTHRDLHVVCAGHGIYLPPEPGSAFESATARFYGTASRRGHWSSQAAASLPGMSSGLATACARSGYRSARAGLAIPHYRPRDHSLCFMEFKIETTDGPQEAAAPAAATGSSPGGSTYSMGSSSERSPASAGLPARAPQPIYVGIGLSSRVVPLDGIVGTFPLSLGLSSSGQLVCGGMWSPVAGQIPVPARFNEGGNVSTYKAGDVIGILVRWLGSQAPWEPEHEEIAELGPGMSPGTAGPPPPFDALQLTFSINGRVVGVSGTFNVPRGTELYPTVSVYTPGVRVIGHFSAADIVHGSRGQLLVTQQTGQHAYLAGSKGYAVFALDGTIVVPHNE